MAGVLYGGGVVGMSGSIAGTTFARNRYGNYARARTTPTNPNTARQQVIRAAIAFLTARWSDTLTAAQRIAWTVYGDNVAMLGKFGQTIHLTGFNHYIRSNAIRKMLGHAVVDAGPTIFELPAKDPTLAVTASEATQLLTTSFDNTMAWSTEATGYIYLFCGLPQNAQRNYFDGPWRQFGWVIGIDPGGAASPDSSAPPWPIAEGQHLWIYARISRMDGRLSDDFRADAFCAA